MRGDKNRGRKEEEKKSDREDILVYLLYGVQHDSQPRPVDHAGPPFVTPTFAPGLSCP